MDILYKLVWLLQRLIRRKIGITKIFNVSVSINQVNSNILKVSKLLTEKQQLNNYKQLVNTPRRIVELSAPVLNPKTGVTWINKRILEESTVWPVIKLLKWEPAPFFYQRVSGKSINLPDNGYYHFVIEDLPRFSEVFNNQKFDQVIVGSNARYIIDALALLNIEQFILRKYPVSCDTLFISEKKIGGIFTKFEYIELQNFSSGIKPVGSHQILFIDRKNKHKGNFDRGLKYSDIIAHKLKRLNAVSVFLEDLSLVEQISLFKSAKLVIGFHGAGLANMAWINRTVKIFEITEERITSHFEHIASVCEHDYAMLKASKLAEYDSVQISKLFEC